LRERVADAMRRAILSGTLAPGSELRQESLAEKFGVSRIPVREALLMLERDGLVIVQPNRRVTVAAMTDDDILDHYRVRALIEGEAAARAAAHDDFSTVQEAERRGELALDSDDLLEFVSASTVFHEAIWELSASAQLTVLANQLWSGRDYTPSNQSEHIHCSQREHHGIVKMLLAHDAEGAREAMRSHIMSVGTRLKQFRDEVRSAPPQ